MENKMTKKTSSRSSISFDQACKIINNNFSFTKDIVNYRNLKKLSITLTPHLTTYSVTFNNITTEYNDITTAIKNYNNIKIIIDIQKDFIKNTTGKR